MNVYQEPHMKMPDGTVLCANCAKHEVISGKLKGIILEGGGKLQ